MQTIQRKRRHSLEMRRTRMASSETMSGRSRGEKLHRCVQLLQTSCDVQWLFGHLDILFPCAGTFPRLFPAHSRYSSGLHLCDEASRVTSREQYRLDLLRSCKTSTRHMLSATRSTTSSPSSRSSSTSSSSSSSTSISYWLRCRNSFPLSRLVRCAFRLLLDWS